MTGMAIEIHARLSGQVAASCQSTTIKRPLRYFAKWKRSCKRPWRMYQSTGYNEISLLCRFSPISRVRRVDAADARDFRPLGVSVFAAELRINEQLREVGETADDRPP